MTFISTSVHRKLLYRTAVALVTLCMVGALISPASAQYRKQQRRVSQLRALGLVEFGPNGKTRLVPITILVEGKFYDASIYRATPVPMALEPGTVYEGFRTGTPVGLFTVSTPETLKGDWRAQGTWRVEGATSRSASASKKPTFKSAAKDDDRPVLKRPGSSGSSQSPSQSSPAPSSQPSTSAPNQDDDRPVLKKPGSPDSSQPTTQGSPPSASGPSSSQGSTSQSPPATPAKNTGTNAESQGSDDNSGRPRLRRGKPEQEQADIIPEPGSPVPTKKTPASPGPGAKNAPPVTLAAGEALAAISDTDGPEPHPFTYELKPEDRAAYMKRVSEMGSAAVTKFEKSRDPQFTSCTLQDASMRAFDPDYSNEPDLVYNAHCTILTGVPARGRRTLSANTGEKHGEAWVTVVARVDLYGEPRQLFASVTDTKHLDEVPRLELIDAVDADGDGRGELLFRELTDSGKAFVVYRVGADKLYALFEGGSGQ